MLIQTALLLIGVELSKYIDRAKQKVMEVFPSSISFVEIEINDYDKFLDLCSPAKITVNERRILGFLAYKNDKELGSCFILNEIGKEAPITFLVCIENESEPKIKYIDVLAYRETRGGEIRSQAFLKQFVGKRSEDRISVGSDIKNIRGATLSAWATTRVVRKAFAISQSLKLGIAEIKQKLDEFKSSKEHNSAVCYLIGDTYLCVECECDNEVFAEIEKLAQKLNKEFSDFYWEGKISADVNELINKYKILSKKLRYFDIFWQGDEQPDLGGVWKGFVVDRFAELFRRNKVSKYEISFGWSSYYFYPAKYINVFGNILKVKGALSITDLDSEYSKIFDPVSQKFIKKRELVLVLHKSAEFSDFASTLCAVWSECTRYIENKGGKILRFHY